MCSRYPNCGHAGPLMDRLNALGDRHCETVLPNHECPYLHAGCKGCTPVQPLRVSHGTLFNARVSVTSSNIDRLPRLLNVRLQMRVDIDRLDLILKRALRQRILETISAYIDTQSMADQYISNRSKTDAT